MFIVIVKIKGEITEETKVIAEKDDELCSQRNPN